MNIKDRFLKYVSFHTTSDENSETSPSSERQKELGAYLAAELAQLGLQDAHMDEFGYVYGFLPASEGCEGLEPIGFLAHMDTSPDVSGKDIKPAVVLYEGGDVALANGEKIELSVFPFLEKYAGGELIVTDGSTLLGADDKAGIAEIVSACELLVSASAPAHRAVAVCFTPDEEIGRGTDNFRAEKFGARFAYTVDGGELGEIEYENFNAASARISFHGVNIHPGGAKNKMKNAVIYACEFVNALPAAETPAHTEGYEGFYHVTNISGDTNSAEIGMIIRDHDREKFEQRKRFVSNLADYMNSVYGPGTVTSEITDSYYNMKEKILPHMELITNAENAMRRAGVEPKIVAIRGGTDGAMLSYKGLPCPNLSTGGANFHSIHEFIPVRSMEKMSEILVNLALAE